jgi:farnesyl-diphosphate farnesyltransferase
MNYKSLRTLLARGETVASKTFCEVVFPTISRTFAINVGKLPSRLSFQVLVSYLLCRIADTIEDDFGLPPKTKAELLHRFTLLLTDAEWHNHVVAFEATCQGMDNTRSDVLLLQHTHYVLDCFFAFPPPVQQHIVHWVSELSQGMAQYALRKNEGIQDVTFLTSLDDLEKYCYYVAGTVGHLLTGLFRHFYPCIDEACYQALTDKASSFGIGLQLTNIIKDSVIDYERGWCYLPRELLDKWQLSGKSLLDPRERCAAQEFMYEIIVRARQHLDDAMTYSLLLPKQAWKARIFCFLPLFMAIKTLSQAAYSERLFTPQNPVKISRSEVKHIVLYTYLNNWCNAQMRRWYAHVSQLLDHKRKNYVKKIYAK